MKLRRLGFKLNLRDAWCKALKPAIIRISWRSFDGLLFTGNQLSMIS